MSPRQSVIELRGLITDRSLWIHRDNNDHSEKIVTGTPAIRGGTEEHGSQGALNGNSSWEHAASIDGSAGVSSSSM